MPATSFAAENDQIQETVQEQAETPAEEAAPVEEAPADLAETPTKEEEYINTFSFSI